MSGVVLPVRPPSAGDRAGSTFPEHAMPRNQRPARTGRPSSGAHAERTVWHQGVDTVVRFPHVDDGQYRCAPRLTSGMAAAAAGSNAPIAEWLVHVPTSSKNDVGNAQSVPGCGEDLECQIGNSVSVDVALDQPVAAREFDAAQFPGQTRE